MGRTMRDMDHAAVRHAARSVHRPGTDARPLQDRGATPLSRTHEELLHGLSRMDVPSRARGAAALSRDAGNAALATLLRGGRGGTWGRRTRTTRVTIARGQGTDRSDASVQRDETVAPAEEVPLDTTPAPGATETIGPESLTTYAVAASSLADVTTAIAARPEAGRVGWATDLRYGASGRSVDAVEVTVTIDLEMPDWTPPPTMLPRARAEWDRWYAALLAHEQGHIDLVHEHFDGLAERLLGRSPRQVDRAFRAARTALTRASAAYDRRTSHGRRQGTVMDLAIEARELEEQRRRDETIDGGREGRAPDTDTDEDGGRAQPDHP